MAKPVAKNARDVTDTELAVLQVLWSEKTATVRYIAESLYGERRQVAARDSAKAAGPAESQGFVARDATVWPHVFRPAIIEADLIARRLQDTADKFCGGSMQPLLTHLLRGKKMSKKDRNSLRNLLDELNDETS